MTTGESTNWRPTHWLTRFLIGRYPKWTLLRIALVVLTSFVLFKFVLVPIRVVGVSMEPDYPNNDWNLVNKWAYRSKTPQRGDVVAIRMAGERVLLMKRIIGLPGDRVSFIRGERHPTVYVNNQPLREDYVKRPVHRSWNWYREWNLAEDQYLVIGDNRSMSFVDHYLGVAEAHQILGKVCF